MTQILFCMGLWEYVCCVPCVSVLSSGNSIISDAIERKLLPLKDYFLQTSFSVM